MSDTIGGTPRATKRPKDMKPPKHWDNAPAPKPEAANKETKGPDDRNPVRYGDWEYNGIAIDF